MGYSARGCRRREQLADRISGLLGDVVRLAGFGRNREPVVQLLM